MEKHTLLIRTLYILWVFTCSCTCAQEYGYDLDHIVITEGAPDPTENIESFSEAELTKDQTLDIVNWNVDWLGAPEMADYEHGDREAHIRQVAGEMVKMEADIYALQEVVVGGGKGNALEDLVSVMNELAGQSLYAGSWSEYHSYYWEEDNPDFPPQCLAYVWDTDVVSVDRDTVLLYDMAGRYDFASGRLPYLLDAVVNLNGFTQRYMIVNVHLKAFAQYSHVREKSMKLLREHLDTYYFSNNVVIAGDFNVAAGPGALGEIVSWGFYNDEEEDGLTDYVHAAGQKADSGYHNIEHILVSNELFDELAYVPKSFRNIRVLGANRAGLSSHYAYMTRLYVHEETGGNDPETEPARDAELHMRPVHYQLIVDYVNNHELPNTHAYPENGENYFGASSYYANFDIETDGSWNRDAFSSWQEAVQASITGVVLPAVYPEAIVDNEVYTVHFDIFDGNTLAAHRFYFVCTQDAPAPVFVPYEGAVHGVSSLSTGHIRVYPNPVQGNLLNINSQHGNISYRLIDLSGKTLLRGELKSGASALSLNNIRKGCYLLLFKHERAGIIVKQLVK